MMPNEHPLVLEYAGAPITVQNKGDVVELLDVSQRTIWYKPPLLQVCKGAVGRPG